MEGVEILADRVKQMGPLQVIMPNRYGDPGRHIKAHSAQKPSRAHTVHECMNGSSARLVVVLSPVAVESMPITQIKQKRDVLNHLYSARSCPATGPCTLSTRIMDLSYSDLLYSHDMTRMGAAKMSHGGALRIYTMCTQMGKRRGAGAGPRPISPNTRDRHANPRSTTGAAGSGAAGSRAEYVTSGPALAPPLTLELLFAPVAHL